MIDTLRSLASEEQVKPAQLSFWQHGDIRAVKLNARVFLAWDHRFEFNPIQLA